MGVEKINVKITADEREAIASAKRVQREMDKVEADAKDAQRAVDGARRDNKGLGARFRGLLGRAGVSFGEEDLRVGNMFKYGRSGFSLQESFVKGRTGGAGAGALKVGFVSVVAGQALGRSLNQAADLRDFIEENKHLTFSQILQEVGNAASQKIFDTFGATGILEGIARLSGTKSEVFDTALQLAYGQTTDVELEIDAQAAAFRARREQIERVNAAKTEAAEAAMRKIDEVAERQLAGLKTDIVRPKDIRLNREQNRRFQRLHDEAAEKRIRREAAAAKEPHQQVLMGEGR